MENKTINVAINGFGRIGRAFFKLAHERKEINIIAINDLGDVENLAYLLRFDSAQGREWQDKKIEISGHEMVVEGHTIKMISEKDPSKLPWGDLQVDVVVESTGVFNEYAKARMHLDAGAKKVVLSAPAKGEPLADIETATVLMGINEEKLKTCSITSNASCTTNAGSPVMAILNEGLGIEKAMLSTVHGYTASQSIVDGPSKDFRKGRAAAANIIPTSTGAAIATTKALPELENKFDGIAVRVPVICGSIADITFVSKKNTTVEEVNAILTKAAGEDRWHETFSVTNEPIVSSDILGSRFASIADLSMTRVVDGNLVKVMAWYDNEMGYTNALVNHVIKTGAYL